MHTYHARLDDAHLHIGELADVITGPTNDIALGINGTNLMSLMAIERICFVARGVGTGHLLGLNEHLSNGICRGNRINTI